MRPTEVKYSSMMLSTLRTLSSSAGCQNHPGRIETSVSPGRQTLPFGSPLLQQLADVWRVVAGVRNARRVDRAPARLPRDAALVPDPAHIRAGVGEHHGAGLQLADERMDARPVVRLLFTVGSFAVGAVEPDLAHGTVAGEQLFQLRAVVIHVRRAAPIARLVAIPRGEIEPEPQPVGAAGVGHRAHHVPLSATPRRRRDGVRRCAPRARGRSRRDAWR